MCLGLRYVDIGVPLAATADRAKGYNVSLVAVLEKPEDALVYAEHPAHERYISSILIARYELFARLCEGEKDLTFS
jgi:hypothetical protein